MGQGTKSTSGGIGVAGLLGVVFVTLKLCHVIDWSWWWVTCPFWGVPAIILAVCVLGFSIAGILYLAAGVPALLEFLSERNRR